MTFTKKQVIISTSIVLVIIASIIFFPAHFAASKEDRAAEQLSELYQDNFVVAKSTASMFGNEFDLTVQSTDSKI
ncbi:MAG: fucose permease, partial [Solibacillus sp.]